MSDVNIWGAGDTEPPATYPVQVNQGGTGGVTEAEARVNLNLYSKTEEDAIHALKVDKTSSTGSAIIPAGTTAQRDATPVEGAIRRNKTLGIWEGWDGTNWTAIGTGGGSGSAAGAFLLNDNTITSDFTVPTGKNALTAGPVTVASGVTVLIPSGSVWTVV